VTFFTFNGLAQTDSDFFTEITVAQGRLNQQEKQLLNNVSRDRASKNVKLIKMKQLRGMPNTNTLSFKIPGEGQPIKVDATHYKHRGDNDFSWFGKLQGRNGNFAFASKPEGAKFGFLSLDDRYFVIRPINNQVSMLMEYNGQVDIGKSCGLDSAPNQLNTPETIPDACNITDGTNCPAEIDVLVLFTPQSQAWALNNLSFWGAALFPFFLELSVEQAFINSGIPNKSIRIKTDFINFIPSTNISSDAVRLKSEAASLRSLHKADIVIALTNQGYTDFFGMVVSLNVESEDAYGIVEIPFSLGNRFTFAHELAHIFGARHDRPNSGTTSDCGHGFVFQDNTNTTRRTIMAIAPTNPGRILHFSNPGVQFNGSNTGDTDNNNARIIRNTGCIVRDFRVSEMSVSLFDNGCDPWGTSKFFSAIASPAGIGDPGQGPFQFEWYVSDFIPFDPANSFFIGSGSNIQVALPSSPQWLFVKAISSDGIERVAST
jgi:hypothetical protein